MKTLKQRRLWFAALVILLLVAGIAWAMRSYQGQKQLAKVREMSRQLTSPEATKLTQDQRREKWTEFRQESSKLSSTQREALGKERSKAANDRLRDFFKLSKKEQTTQLDREIRQMEERRREFERMQKQQGNTAMRGGGGQRGARTADAEKRDQRARNFLDRTSPEERSMHTEYRRLMEQRRQQLGLPPRSPGGGRRG